MKVLFATQNKGKQREIANLLKDSASLLFPGDLGLETLEVEESGETFKENAFLKAKTFAERSGLISAADDSGLSIDALDGMPGVYSNRYFPGSFHEKNMALLKKLEGIKNRSAKFITAICLYNPDYQNIKYFLGEIKGSIALEIRGDKGFGYDPVFIPENSKKTWGELGPEEKNKNSHRAIALEKLKEYVQAN